ASTARAEGRWTDAGNRTAAPSTGAATGPERRALSDGDRGRGGDAARAQPGPERRARRAEGYPGAEPGRRQRRAADGRPGAAGRQGGGTMGLLSDGGPAVRDRIGRAIFTRVAGPAGPDSRARIHGTPGPRWFGPDRPVRRVHGDASMFIGGLAALLHQSLHPLAMAAVAGHSGFRGDPWGRLQRT